jgi:hypothetical protein
LSDHTDPIDTHAQEIQFDYPPGQGAPAFPVSVELLANLHGHHLAILHAALADPNRGFDQWNAFTDSLLDAPDAALAELCRQVQMQTTIHNLPTSFAGYTFLKPNKADVAKLVADLVRAAPATTRTYICPICSITRSAMTVSLSVNPHQKPSP